MPAVHPDEPRFWLAAAEVMARPGVTRSTMMGFPCVRVNGAFFACFDRMHGALVVKLPADTATGLVAAGQADAFAPNGRRFREWASIPRAHEAAWPARLDDAFDFVANSA